MRSGSFSTMGTVFPLEMTPLLSYGYLSNSKAFNPLLLHDRAMCMSVSIGTYLLRQVIIDDERVSTVISEKLAHRTAGVRRQVLQRGRIGSCGAHDCRVLHCVRVRQSLHDLSDG